MTYIYMTEDNMRAPLGLHGNTKVFLKIGYNNNPVRRGGQMRQASRRSLGFEIDTMRIKSHTVPLSDDTQDLALFVESFVIKKVLHMPSANLSAKGKEFIRISIADRARCYTMLPIWVAEALAQYTTKGEA